MDQCVIDHKLAAKDWNFCTQCGENLRPTVYYHVCKGCGQHVESESSEVHYCLDCQEQILNHQETMF